ncbi:MAG: MFS transporter, partial [Firmicutes bacterium]|nr:MFS transporter [Bacillota bacterium]
LDELGAARGMMGTQAAFGVAIFSVVSLLQPLSGMLSDKIGRSKCILIGMILLCVGWSSIALIGSLNIGIVLLFSGIAGIGTMLYTPASFALAQNSAVEGSGGLIRGLFQSATGIGSAVSAIFGAVIYRSIGIDNVFYLLIAATVLCVIFAILLSFTAKKNERLKEAKGS